MEKEFVPYELALKMKQLGFDEPCISYYTVYGKFSNDYSAPRKYNSEFELGSYISAPTYSQAFRWFESKGYRNYVASNQFGGKVNYWFAITPPEELAYSDVEGRSTKEEAELACLKKLIEIVEQ
jgi:hypothetical protein